MPHGSGLGTHMEFPQEIPPNSFQENIIGVNETQQKWAPVAKLPFLSKVKLPSENSKSNSIVPHNSIK